MTTLKRYASANVVSNLDRRDRSHGQRLIAELHYIDWIVITDEGSAGVGLIGVLKKKMSTLL